VILKWLTSVITFFEKENFMLTSVKKDLSSGKIFALSSALLAILVAAPQTLAAEKNNAEELKNCKNILNNFAGSYLLVKRTLPNGHILSGSEVQGTLTFTKDGHRGLAVSIHNTTDNKFPEFFSASVQSDYSINSSTFTDRLRSMVLHIGQPTETVKYNFGGSAKTATVICDKGNLLINNPPYDPVEKIVITKKGMSATLAAQAKPLAGAVDEWVRVK
jgi:hypothetical protein